MKFRCRAAQPSASKTMIRKGFSTADGDFSAPKRIFSPPAAEKGGARASARFPGGDCSIFFLLRRQRLQPVDQVERLARGELVGAGLTQQRFGRRLGWGRLGVAAGGAEQREVVGEPRQRPALLAFFEHA